jgi:predicted metal-dependent enzyme (double-stranded beta helix superfamily)
VSRTPTLLALVVVALVGLAAAGALARGAQPPPDATPGAVGVTGPVLGWIDPVVAPGFRLEVAVLDWAPGAYVTRHTHPSAFVVCVQAGAFGFAVHQGAATVTRAGDGDAPESTEALALDAEAVLDPGDCVAADQYAGPMVHTAWNAGDETVVLWSADLYKTGEPFTTFVDEQGTPIP